MMAGNLWTVEEAAAYLRLRTETIRQMARDGHIPAIKVGARIWRFDPERIQEWLRAQAHTTNQDEDRHGK